MGLFLSTFVSCVGVLELVAFYFHLRRQFMPVDRQDSGLDAIINNYKEQLAKKHTLTLEKVDRNFALSTSPKVIFLAQNDKRNHGSTTFSASQHVVQQHHVEVATATVSIQETCSRKSCVDNVQLRTEETISPSVEKIYLGEESSVDPIHGKRESSPFPTYERLAPRGSICELVGNPSVNVTEVDEEEAERDHNFEVFRSNFLSRSRSKSPRKNKSSSPRRKRSAEVDDRKQNNVDATTKSRDCKSASPEPRSGGILKMRRRSSSFTDLNEASTSQSDNLQLVQGDYWRRSPSPFQEFLDVDPDTRFELVFNEDFKNSLDGVKLKDERKKDFKRRREMRNREKPSSSEEAGGSKDAKDAFWVK